MKLESGQRLDYETMLSTAPAITTSYDGCKPSYQDRYPEQLVLTAAVGLEQWDAEDQYPAKRLAKFHGRNVELLAG